MPFPSKSLGFLKFHQGKDASMGLANGTKPLAFGHSADAAVDIEGLVVSLLRHF